ncbi:SIR2 family protein [Ciceribacter ferrooxidans]|uniref:SIR2 family protein n=1 Tax=Ciceribacter ferrooxidans TaxID=2509717 RepID=A0A4Q2TJJ6_9HYPH|nr:SIR2 family protein [Ciceribacter ferrooxidans]RYC17841.1 SIR2 family protein [Ciceribacter ferrooxidans]
MSNDVEAARQLDRHIRSPRQVWLTGAGISCGAGLPLMYPLTGRIFHLLETNPADTEALALVKAIRDDLPDALHIEHVLSHLGDLIALAERAKDASAVVGSDRVHKTKLQAAHHTILRHIRDTLRWGYIPASATSPEQEGKLGKPIVKIDHHRRFIRALYKVNRAGLDERREAIQFITTNYDTLIEDALALELISYIDGFSGGAIAGWDEQSLPLAAGVSTVKAVITKLHGSIDWYRSGKENGRVFRVRHDDAYPDRSDSNGNVVIYPQSTKYMASREDPFGFMFQRFRGLLSAERQQVLFVCGYSFGDDHIDAIIEQNLLHIDSKTTLVALSKTRNAKLKRWGESRAGERIFVLAEDGLYRGSAGPFFPPTVTIKRDWWSFEGTTSLLENGLPTDIAEVIE